MHRPSIVPFVPVRGDSRSGFRLSKNQHHIFQPMNSRPIPSSQLLIQEAPPEDARLLDAAHTLVNLQQTTERQSRQNNNSGLRSDTHRGQEIDRTINSQSPIAHRNQLSISPVGPAPTTSSGSIVTHLQSPVTTTIPIVTNPLPIQMVGSPTSSIVVTSSGNPMPKGISPSNNNNHVKDNPAPERAMMPPPSIGRGGGRGSTGRGIKPKGVSITGSGPGRGRGRGRGRGVLGLGGSSSQTTKGTLNVVSLPVQSTGLYMEQKHDPSIISPMGMVKPPPMHTGLRMVTPSDLTPNDEGIIHDSPMDTINRVITLDGGSCNKDKDNCNEYTNGDDPIATNVTAESTFTIGSLKVKTSIFDDLLNERKIELLSDPEVMALLSSVMEQSKNNKND